MATYNQELWQTVVFLLLSKIVKEADTTFAQNLLINPRNIELANRFVQMVGDTTTEKKIKFALLKAMRELEKEAIVVRVDEESLQLIKTGFTQMKEELNTAMTKIAKNFPDSTAKEDPEPTVQ